MPFDLEHSKNVTKHKFNLEGQGAGVISSMRLSYAKNGLKCKMNIFGERGDQPVGTKS